MVLLGISFIGKKMPIVLSKDKKRKKSIELMARNVQPQIKCSCCENEATHVCAQCFYDNTGWLCSTCAQIHECGEDMLLPVVNSPRVGVCGYCG